MGADITLGIVKQLVDKTEKSTDASNNIVYLPTGETRDQNEINKVFRTRDGLTVTEIRAALTEPAFKEQWLKRWQGEVHDKTTTVAGVQSGAPDLTAKREVGAQAPQESLFK